MAELCDILRDRVLLCDGSTLARIQALALDIERDFLGAENCTEILNRARPDIVRGLHRSYLEAGADIVLTNSCGGSPLTLAEFGLDGEAEALNRRAAELAREAVAAFAGDGRDRFVLGSIGPGTKLLTLGHCDYETIEAALTIQAAGLVASGLDGILIETCQDPLQMKAAFNGARQALAAPAGAALERALPIFVQVTVETTGTRLVGTDIAAAATIVAALGVNCATGPQEMADHVKLLDENWAAPIFVQPNAGLPELVDGRACYPLAPADLASSLERFVAEDGVNLVGGCCGTGPDHIRALDAMLRRRAASGHRPRPKPRQIRPIPAVAPLYGQTPLRQERALFSIGERCNANGSRQFRRLQEAGDWQGCVEMARAQLAEGSHALDICTAFVRRDEVADMSALVARLAGAVAAPLVIDSTELRVLEAALKLYGGKAIINSINFEDGEEPARERLDLARRFGAAVIALTIDEQGMAKDATRKLAIAHRLHDLVCTRHGFAPGDLLIDPLTFTIGTGNEDDRKLGLATLEAIELIARDLPQCQIVLGLSNISFGAKPAGHHVLNSVFLDHALKRGMTGAIVHVSKIMPLHAIAPDEARLAEDLILDRRAPGYDPL